MPKTKTKKKTKKQVRRLAIGEQVLYVTSECDWCGQEGVTFESTQERTEFEKVVGDIDVYKVIEDWEYEYIGGGLFQSSKLVKVIKGEIQHAYLTDYDYEKVTLPKAHICQNCVKQLAKENI